MGAAVTLALGLKRAHRAAVGRLASRRAAWADEAGGGGDASASPRGMRDPSSIDAAEFEPVSPGRGRYDGAATAYGRAAGVPVSPAMRYQIERAISPVDSLAGDNGPGSVDRSGNTVRIAMHASGQGLPLEPLAAAVLGEPLITPPWWATSAARSRSLHSPEQPVDAGRLTPTPTPSTVDAAAAAASAAFLPWAQSTGPPTSNAGRRASPVRVARQRQERAAAEALLRKERQLMQQYRPPQHGSSAMINGSMALPPPGSPSFAALSRIGGGGGAGRPPALMSPTSAFAGQRPPSSNKSSRSGSIGHASLPGAASPRLAHDALANFSFVNSSMVRSHVIVTPAARPVSAPGSDTQSVVVIDRRTPGQIAAQQMQLVHPQPQRSAQQPLAADEAAAAVDNELQNQRQRAQLLAQIEAAADAQAASRAQPATSAPEATAASAATQQQQQVAASAEPEAAPAPAPAAPAEYTADELVNFYLQYAQGQIDVASLTEEQIGLLHVGADHYNRRQRELLGDDEYERQQRDDESGAPFDDDDGFPEELHDMGTQTDPVVVMAPGSEAEKAGGPRFSVSKSARSGAADEGGSGGGGGGRMGPAVQPCGQIIHLGELAGPKVAPVLPVQLVPTV